jgi:hypothetical protein
MSQLTTSMGRHEKEIQMNTLSRRSQPLVAAVILVSLALFANGRAAAAEQQKGILSNKQVRELVAKANSPADHTKLARHYTAMAEKHEAEAKEHAALAAEYRKNPRASEVKRPMAPDTASHCEYYAEHCRKAAAEMRAMAKAHEDMARTGQ